MVGGHVGRLGAEILEAFVATVFDNDLTRSGSGGTWAIIAAVVPETVLDSVRTNAVDCRTIDPCGNAPHQGQRCVCSEKTWSFLQGIRACSAFVNASFHSVAESRISGCL